MLQLKTLNDIFFLVATSSQPRSVLYMDAAGNWQAFSGMQMYQRVRAFAEALSSWGIRKGDRVAILAENRWEWAVADFAVLALGATDVPIYPTLTSDQIGVLLADSGTRVAVLQCVAIRPVFAIPLRMARSPGDARIRIRAAQREE